MDKDPAKAYNAYTHACENGDQRGCHALGLMHAEGRHVPQNIPAALGHLGSACSAGEGVSCGAMALILRLQSPPDIEKSLVYCRKGCELGDLDSCAQEAYIFTQPPRSDMKQAAHLFKRYCNQSHAKSCFNYAVMLYKGQGVAEDREHSLRVMSFACELGDAEACSSIGR